MTRALAAGLALACLLGGCQTLRPGDAMPAAPVPASWAAGRGDPGGDGGSLGWREVLVDPRLAGLVGLAIENNRDLRLATANIRKARAGFEAQRAELAPAVGIGGAGNVGETVAGTSRLYGLSLASSAYELDLFGRARDLADAAFEDYLGTAEARRTVRIGLVADVATAFYGLAADRERLALARETLASQQAALGLIRRTVEAGSSSDLALAQARTSVETARGDEAAYATAIEKGEAALALLVGAPPGVAVPRLSAARPPAPVPAGLSSEALLRRPDILQAEHALRAADADIGAARAAFFPSVTLTASAGLSSRALGGLFAAGSGVWAFAPQVNLPIFDGGRLRAGLASAEAGRDAAVARYEKAIQVAFREVSDALAERATVGRRISAQEGLVAAAARSHELALARFREGVDSYLAVLDAQRQLYAARQGLIGVRLSRMTNLVALYKALGGGWRAGAAGART